MIHTERLVVRPFQGEDWPSLYAYLSHPAIYRFEPGAPISPEEAQNLARARSLDADYWAVTLRESMELVGHLYFHQMEPHLYLTWELGYIFNPVCQNKGYASESSRGLIQYAFAHLGVHRVVAFCNQENIASWRVMEKIGMRREGCLRQNIFFHRDGEGSPLWIDSYEYAILKEDFGNY